MLPALRKDIEKKPKTKNPWLLEAVKNGLKATNVIETSQYVRRNKSIEIVYFENDRIFGVGAFTSALKVTELFGELQGITPRTKGFIFGEHKYLYHGRGILRVNYIDGNEEYFSDETLRNKAVAAYFPGIAYSTEEDKIQSMITELDNATSNDDNTDRTRKRIPCQDSE